MYVHIVLVNVYTYSTNTCVLSFFFLTVTYIEQISHHIFICNWIFQYLDRCMSHILQTAFRFTKNSEASCLRFFISYILFFHVWAWNVICAFVHSMLVSGSIVLSAIHSSNYGFYASIDTSLHLLVFIITCFLSTESVKAFPSDINVVRCFIFSNICWSTCFSHSVSYMISEMVVN